MAKTSGAKGSIIFACVVLVVAIGSAAAWNAGVPGLEPATCRDGAGQRTSAPPTSQSPVSSEDVFDHRHDLTRMNTTRAVWTSDGGVMYVACDRVLDDQPGLPAAGDLLHQSATGATRRIGVGVAPLASPDGQRLAFVGEDGDIVVHNLATGSSEPLRRRSSLRVVFPDMSWSQSGAQLVFSTMNARAFGLYTFSTLSILEGGRVRNVLSRRGSISSPAFVPNTNLIAFYAVPANGRGATIEVLDTQNGATRVLRQFQRGEHGRTELLPSPDGEVIAFSEDSADGMIGEIGRIGFMALNGDVLAMTGLDAPYLTGPISWNSGDGVYAGCKRRVVKDLCIVRLDGAVESVAAFDDASIHQPQVSTDGQEMLWLHAEINGRAQIRRGRVDRLASAINEQHIVYDLTPDFAQFELGRSQLVNWSGRDGLLLSGTLLVPEGEGPFPLVTDVTGGPNGAPYYGGIGMLLVGTGLEWQWWVSQGYAVFAPAYRATGVYGIDVLHASEANANQCADLAGDIASGVESLVAQGIARAGATFALGHSHGGHAVPCVLVYEPDALTAAIAKNGIADVATVFEQIRDPDRLAGFEDAYGGPMGSEGWVRNSPLAMSDRITTPVMFITGSEDLPQSFERLHQALRAQGVETELHIFENEGHVFTMPENQRRVLDLARRWFDQHRTPSQD